MNGHVSVFSHDDEGTKPDLRHQITDGESSRGGEDSDEVFHQLDSVNRLISRKGNEDLKEVRLRGAEG